VCLGTTLIGQSSDSTLPRQSTESTKWLIIGMVVAFVVIVIVLIVVIICMYAHIQSANGK